jgi:hypothetical protein
MHDHLQVFTAIGLGLGLAVAVVQSAVAQQNPVTAIDIALEPDATMVQHAMAANARLLRAFPKGFALDETHHPHISMLQQIVRTDELDKVFAAANAVMAKEKPTAWTLKAFKYYYIPSPPLGAIRVVHVLAGWRVSLSAWQLWHGSKGTRGVDADALRTAAESLRLHYGHTFREIRKS